MPSDKLVAEFVALRERFIWTRICFNTFDSLYGGGGETKRIMEKSAITFFSDLNRVLQEYCLLQFCRVTDPSPDLTVSRIVNGLKAEALLTAEIEQSAKDMLAYRELIVAARNKIIAHADRKVALNETILGEHPAHALEQFFESMFDFNDGVGRALGIGPLDFRATPCEGDVLDLLRCLRQSVGD